MHFRDALIEAAQQSDTPRGDLFRLRLALRIPRVAQAIEEECCRDLCAMGAIAPGATAIDWTALVEALKQLLPIILEFIKALMVLF